MALIPTYEALDRVANCLLKCEHHLENAQRLPGQQRELLGTAVSSLKSTWNILNNMDKSTPAVAEWFRRLSETAKNDPLLSFFKDERDMIMKEGVDRIRGVHVRARPGASVAAGPDGFTFRWRTEQGVQQMLVPRPTNAVNSFMGDSQGGGMGYIVELPDGTRTAEYVQVPLECAQVTLFYQKAPLEHLGKQLTTREADVLVGLYHAFWVRACQDLRSLVQVA